MPAIRPERSVRRLRTTTGTIIGKIHRTHRRILLVRETAVRDTRHVEVLALRHLIYAYVVVVRKRDTAQIFVRLVRIVRIVSRLVRPRPSHPFHVTGVYLAQYDFIGFVRIAADAARDGVGRRIVTHFLRMAREAFMYNFRKPELSYMTPDEEQFCTKFARFVNEGNILGFQELYQTAIRDIGQNANAKMVFFDVTMKVAVLLHTT